MILLIGTPYILNFSILCNSIDKQLISLFGNLTSSHQAVVGVSYGQHERGGRQSPISLCKKGSKD